MNNNNVQFFITSSRIKNKANDVQDTGSSRPDQPSPPLLRKILGHTLRRAES